MKTINALPKLMAILFFIIAIASCDEDFNTIGTEIISDDHLLSELDESSTVISYSRKLDPVQTNFMVADQLGLYNDPVFGKSTVNYVSQLFLTETDPVFGDELGQSLTLESVILYLPYFSESATEEETTTYTLDSVYGNSPIEISVYESNLFLRDLDPETNFEEAQLYYSNQKPLIESNLGALLTTLEDFKPDNEGFVFVEGEGDDEIETLVAPGIRVELPLAFFQEKILDKEGDIELSNNNNFKNYFRGIYFKVESITDDGNLFIFSPENASITLKYNHIELDDDGDPVLDDDDEPVITDKEFVLEFGGIDLNVYDNNLSLDVETALENPNTTQGEETLYVRGGEGVLTVINLFGEDTDDNGIAEELEILRDKSLLINEANLIFYVDQNKVEGGSTEPERLIIYNLETNNVLADYFSDPTASNEPDNALTRHLGKLKRGTDGKGDYYKIKITNHISNIINKDSTNAPLGLIVSQNVLLEGMQIVDSLTNPDGDLPRIKKVPKSAVLSPEGTALYGNNTTNEEKRLKLQLFYIDPNN